MNNIEWLSNNQIRIEPPKNPKKITGTRLAAILGLNRWNTPFKAWCEITKTYQEPFIDSIYTIAGKTIEPKQAEYMKVGYFMGNIKSPTDIYGEDYFNTTKGDFFKHNSVFGGMWDYLLTDDNGNIKSVLEMKTTKRSEDWANGIPTYYALQASLYAYLLGVDDVIMIASFLEDKDYATPEKYNPNASNTIAIEFKVSKQFPNFGELIEQALEWWEVHVVGGISPPYDEEKDKDILAHLRTTTLNPTTNIQDLLTEWESVKQHLDELDIQAKPLNDRLKQINDIIKDYAKANIKDEDKKVLLKGNLYNFILSKSQTTEIDKELLKTNGLLDTYTKTKTTYRLTMKEV